MVVRIPTARIAKLCNPLEIPPWKLDGVLSTQAIADAVKEKRYCRTPLDLEEPSPQLHAERIAWLVQHGWEDPIEIDVGIPEMGFCVTWPVEDGNHRLAAALFLRSRYILANVSGSVDYAKSALGVTI